MSPRILARNRPSGCDRHHKNAFYLGSHFEWRMPVDDENTLSVAWFFVRVPKEREPNAQQRVQTWSSPIKDERGR
jgi:5,5'-dehydrodivanillate O-demethylase oxygenase subunit